MYINLILIINICYYCNNYNGFFLSVIYFWGSNNAIIIYFNIISDRKVNLVDTLPETS